MEIRYNYQNNYRPAFGAKFLHSESLKQIAQYAVEHGKFDKLNQARKDIDRSNLVTRIRVDFGINDKGFPVVTFTRYEPKRSVLIAKSMDDYVITKITKCESSKKENVVKFAFEKILKMGNNAPKNNLYRRIVVNKK